LRTVRVAQREEGHWLQVRIYKIIWISRWWNCSL